MITPLALRVNKNGLELHCLYDFEKNIFFLEFSIGIAFYWKVFTARVIEFV